MLRITLFYVMIFFTAESFALSSKKVAIKKISKDKMSHSQAKETIENFIEALYFSTATERQKFIKFFDDKISNLFQLKGKIERADLVMEYNSERLVVNLFALNTLDTYNSLRQCQMDKSLAVDPLSTSVTNVLTTQSPLFQNYNMQGVLKHFVYIYYQRYLIKESGKIYQSRLDDCLFYLMDDLDLAISSSEEESPLSGATGVVNN